MKNFYDELVEEKNKNGRQIISVSVDKELLEKIEIFCQQNRFSRSEFARSAFKLAMDNLLKKGRRGYVYFIEATGTSRFKIGRTQDLKKRLTDLQTGSPFDLSIFHSIDCFDCHRTEKLFHDKYADKLKTGEWFALTEDDIRYIQNKDYLKERLFQEAIG